MWWLVLFGLWALCFADNLYWTYRERRSFSPQDLLIRAFWSFVLPFLVGGLVLYAIWAFRPSFRRTAA